MPAGCDFICENKECDNYNSGFVMTSPWPLGNICLVINQSGVKLNDKFREELIRLKNEGRKYACINYPNTENIEIEGYRIHKWCQKCNRIWQYDVMLRRHDDTFEEALKEANIPETCSEDGEKLMDFNESLSNGIKCPKCNQDLKQSRWFSKEK